VMKGAAVPWQVIHVPRFLRLHSQLWCQRSFSRKWRSSWHHSNPA
jgi:hypothetical protein